MKTEGHAAQPVSAQPGRQAGGRAPTFASSRRSSCWSASEPSSASTSAISRWFPHRCAVGSPLPGSCSTAFAALRRRLLLRVAQDKPTSASQPQRRCPTMSTDAASPRWPAGADDLQQEDAAREPGPAHGQRCKWWACRQVGGSGSSWCHRRWQRWRQQQPGWGFRHMDPHRPTQ